jgi:thiol-disulfide isomerase/thioredoxin
MLYSQLSFTFSVNIRGIDSGLAFLEHVADGEYYFSNIKKKEVKIVDGRLTFVGEMNYPHAFYLVVSSGGKRVHSEIFFIGPGSQYLDCSFDSLASNYLNIHGSPVNKEYIQKFLPASRRIDSAYQSYISFVKETHKKFGNDVPQTEKNLIAERVKVFKGIRDSVITNYCHRNTRSYVAIWKLIDAFHTNGYKKYYRDAFKALHPSTKQTLTGKILSNRLKNASVTEAGSIFPELVLLDTSNAIRQLTLKGNYTLIDFWFSSCGPCIAEFPSIKKIYDKYKSRGFKIVGVSVDIEKKRGDWVEAILKHNIIWDNLWDMDGVKSKKFSINSFPTNFLVDKSGKIIQKNITPQELDIFLNKNL